MLDQRSIRQLADKDQKQDQKSKPQRKA